MTLSPVDAILDAVLAEETGQYTNYLDDDGGPTRWGITLKTLSDYLGRVAKPEDVKALTRDQALLVLHQKFVEAPRLDAVLAISASLGERLIDGGVLSGPATLVRFLQVSLNAFNLNGSRYPDVTVDGGLGSETLKSLQSFLSWRGSAGEAIMVVSIECQLGAHFLADAQNRPKDEQWVFGWFQQRIRMPSYVSSTQSLRA